MIQNSLCFFQNKSHGVGYITNLHNISLDLFGTLSHCDGKLYDESLSVGDVLYGSDGETLTLMSNDETVITPAGNFDGCILYESCFCHKYDGTYTCRAYFKKEIGIVKYTVKNSGFTDTFLLSSYEIKGGNGLIPLAIGNKWHYSIDCDPEYIVNSITYTVTHSDSQKTIVTSCCECKRNRYDQTTWQDAIEEIRLEYCSQIDNDYGICDVSAACARAEALAKTPMEIAHTKAATSVVRRIMATDAKLNPDCKTENVWNFFDKSMVHRSRGRVYLTHNFRFSFEWKSGCSDTNPVLCNHIYGILQDAGNCLWSDTWQIGMNDEIVYQYTDDTTVKTKISCTDAGTVETQAGTFENCMKISFTVDGMTYGIKYRGGNKDYYFANGIGIVKFVSHYEAAQDGIYELTAYEGIGDGYMPLENGLSRTYEAIGLADGYYGAATYTYVEEDGELAIFADKTGIRHIPAPISCYNYIENEVIEDRLWDAKKYGESRLRHDANNFHLLLHFLYRPSRTWAEPEKARAWGKYRIGVIESLAYNGDIPKAWRGAYWYLHFITACYCFGCYRKDEGYEYLEKSFALYDAWYEIPDGETLEIGDPLLFGGIQYVKGKEYIVLPNGTKEPVNDNYVCWLNFSPANAYYGMTAPHGWEWFDPARNEERFKECIARMKTLIDKK